MGTRTNNLFLLGVLVAATALLTANDCLRAEDFYVNNELGDDHNDGHAKPIGDDLSSSGPFKTIGRALKAARFGDRIFVQKTGTPYRESLTIQGSQHGGTNLRKFQIISDGAILDGTRPVYDKWEHYRNNIYRFQPELKSYQQLYQDGRPLPQTKLDSSGKPDDLEANQWTLHRGWVYFRTDGSDPVRYDLSYCFHQVGISLYQVHDVVIEGIVVQGFQLDGINAHDGVERTALVSNVCRGNGRSGISVGGASRVSIGGCLIGDNGAAQVRTEGYSKTWIDSCDIIESQLWGPPVEQTDGSRIIRDQGGQK